MDHQNSHTSKKPTFKSIIFAVFSFFFWPVLFGILMSAGSSSLLIGIAASLMTMWLIYIGQKVSDIHRWTKRINGSIQKTTEPEETKEIFRIGRLRINWKKRSQ